MTTGAPQDGEASIGVAGPICACGAPVRIQRTNECYRCYKRRWHTESRAARLAAATCSACGQVPVVVLASLLCRACAAAARSAARRRAVRSRPYIADREPATYLAAHDRVRRLRGRAAAWPCLECGNAAAQWAYRAGSARERITVDTVNGRSQRRHWSPEPADYDPLCVRCHRNRDHGDAPARRHDPAHRARWEAESYARQVASPEGRRAYRDRKNSARRNRSDTYQARAWARENGIEVAPRGPVHRATLNAWQAAGAPRTTTPPNHKEHRQRTVDTERS